MRYDGGGLDVSGGALHLELSGGDILGPSNTGPANLVLQRAPAGAWTIETTVRVPLRSGSQQAGLLVYRDDGNYVKLVAAAAAGGKVRLQLLSEAGDAVARDGSGSDGVAAAQRHLPASPGQVGLALHGSTGARTARAGGALGSVVNARLTAGASYGLVALGPGRQGAAALRGVRALPRPAVEPAGGAAPRRPGSELRCSIRLGSDSDPRALELGPVEVEQVAAGGATGDRSEHEEQLVRPRQ